MDDLWSNLSIGFGAAASLQNLGYAFLGCFAGTLVGVLPGIGALAAVAVLLPVTFYLEPLSGLIMLAGIFYGAQYGGSTAAILVNLPGDTSAVVSCIEGHQMALQGRAGAALATVGLGSFFAGCVSTLVIALFAPPLARVAQSFGGPEYFSLMVFGLTGAVILTRGSVLKAVAMIAFGLLLGLVGIDDTTGGTRFTLGITSLLDGITFVPMAVGIFGVAGIIGNLSLPAHGRSMITDKIERLWPTRDDFRKAWGAVVRGTGVGSFLGVLPGGGAALSSFASYVVEKQVSRDPGSFGRGAIQGLAGPEAANNAGAQTSFIPLLTLGIPGNAMMAILVGAFTIHGIQPGPQIMNETPTLFWGLIASMWIGNLMLVVINLPLIGIWVQLLRVPYRFLFLSILVFSTIGVYSLNSNVFDVFLMAIFALLGYMFMRLECDVVPMVLAFVLGPLMESNLRKSMLVSGGDPMIFVQRPISLALLLAALGLLIVIVAPSLRAKREIVFQEDE